MFAGVGEASQARGLIQECYTAREARFICSWDQGMRPASALPLDNHGILKEASANCPVLRAGVMVIIETACHFNACPHSYAKAMPSMDSGSLQ